MPYSLVSGAITPQCGNSVVKTSESRYDLEEYAEKYVQDNLGTQVHIFDWVTGYQSKPSVSTDRLWDSGYVQPSMPKEPTETVDPL